MVMMHVNSAVIFVPITFPVVGKLQLKKGKIV